jgi:hypothetical protein
MRAPPAHKAPPATAPGQVVNRGTPKPLPYGLDSKRPRRLKQVKGDPQWGKGDPSKGAA